MVAEPGSLLTDARPRIDVDTCADDGVAEAGMGADAAAGPIETPLPTATYGPSRQPAPISAPASIRNRRRSPPARRPRFRVDNCGRVGAGGGDRRRVKQSRDPRPSFVGPIGNDRDGGRGHAVHQVGMHDDGTPRGPFEGRYIAAVIEKTLPWGPPSLTVPRRSG